MEPQDTIQDLCRQQQIALRQNDLAKGEELYRQAQSAAKTSEAANHTAILHEMNGALFLARFNYEIAVKEFEKAIAVYQKTGNNQGSAHALQRLGAVYYANGQYKKCIEVSEEAATLAQNTEQQTTIANAYSNIGLAEANIGNFARAIERSTKAVGLYRKMNDRYNEPRALLNLGMAYRLIGDYEQAMALQLTAARLYEETGQTLQQALCLDSVGTIIKDMGQFEKALDYHYQSLTIRESVNDLRGMYYAHFNISNAYYRLERYEEALAELHKALELTTTPDRPNERCRVHAGMATVYITMGRLSDAEEHCFIAQQLAAEIEDGQIQAHANGVLGTLHFKNKRYDEAKKVLKESLEFVVAKEMWPDAVICETQLYEIAEAQGDTASALHHFRNRTEIQSRQLDVQIQQRMLLLQIQYDSERKDAELDGLRKEKQDLIQQENAINEYNLTPREKDILQLLTDGLSYKMIAAQLGIAYETTREHIANLYKKLGVGTNTEAVAKALEGKIGMSCRQWDVRFGIHDKYKPNELVIFFNYRNSLG